MVSGSKIESEGMALLHDLDSKKQQIEAEYSRKLEILNKQIEAVNTTVRLLKQRADSPESELSIEVPNVSGMKQVEAVAAIAQRNNGHVKVKDAVRILKAADILKAKKAWGALHSVIQRSGRFKKVAPGKFELVVDQNDFFKN